ncbi:SGNH/GDSL hydrolase family protein [Streptomyces sp. N35]|uniref:SGNH/GDSL hydrolase family protein n=1 Tax=Streptomyces sp. N35 TaxID=2795730 RepID=UPI0018F5B890|nr:SGNH/GDSL hydrolase family protein [Streptomyces sp. N35]
MNSNEITPRSTTPRRRRRTALALPAAIGAGALLLGLAACGGAQGGASGKDKGSENLAAPDRAGGGSKKLLWMGDSIAHGEGLPLGASMKESGVDFRSIASDGGGNVVDDGKMTKKLAADTFTQLARELSEFKPDIVAYQISTFDWGTKDQQRAGYEKLARTVEDAGAQLMIVTAPPYKIDEFYKRYEKDLANAPQVAKEVAGKNKDDVRFVDASELWGTDPAAAKAQRAKKDGIHACQQGTATFAKWFGDQLEDAYGIRPAAPEKWAKGSWTGDKAFTQLDCG